MTEKNLFHLAKSGVISFECAKDRKIPPYCMAAAIDVCFDRHDVPSEVYDANYKGMEGSAGERSAASEEFWNSLGCLFNHPNPEEFCDETYYFRDYDEFEKDMADLRGKAIVLLDTNGGKHSVGLRPYGNDPDKWQLVGIGQVITIVSLPDRELKLQFDPIKKLPIFTTREVWDFLCENNPPERTTQTAAIFPPEPN